MTSRSIVVGWLWLCCLGIGSGTALGQDQENWFENRIRPILAGTCFRCHGDQKTGGELRIDSRESLLRGGRSGPAIDLTHPDDSLLLQAVRREAAVAAMPPEAKQALRPDQVADLRQWLEAGAPWPAQTAKFVSSGHWAYEPLRAAPRPDVPDVSWPRNSVDPFVLRGLERHQHRPGPQADRRTLIRRATFDLTGLPPTPAEVEAFLNDDSADAWERVVDRLLASPRYGERWGRLWLDVVRYADTAGETADYPIPTAWRYRNQVIHALNADLPYDQFAREQMAGDLLAHRAPGPRYAEQVISTGYLALSRRFGFDSENYHHLTIHDTIDNLGQTFLGLSLGCARCHDHKFDAVSTRDYYALYGIFDSTRYPFPGSEQKPRVRTLAALVPPREARARWREFEQRVSHLSQGLARLGKPVPNATLRWLGDLDGDFELQAPAAGGSYGVLVPPWMSQGPVSVTTAAQSPYRNVYAAARVGASVPAAAAAYQVTQTVPEWLTGGDQSPVFVNLDFRLASAAPGQTGRHRFAVTDAAGRPAFDLSLGADGAWLRTGPAEVLVATIPADQWVSLQCRLDPATRELSLQVGHPGHIQSSGPLPLLPDWSGRAGQVLLEGTGDTPRPGFEFDNLAVRADPFPPVSTEIPTPPGAEPPEDPTPLIAELRALAGIDGDLEQQPPGGAPTSPWNPGPNSLVKLSAEGQSPFANLYPPGKQGFVLPNRGEYDGFGVTLPPTAPNAEGQLHLAFDFRLGAQAAGGDGSWRFYIGQGAGSSAALELFFNGRQFFRRSGAETGLVGALRGETWYQVRVVLDLQQKTYRGELCRRDETIPFEGLLATGWDGKITYSFIDSYGHLPGVRPALAVDNFVLQTGPLRPFDAPATESDGSGAQTRRERIALLKTRLGELERRSQQDQQELTRLLQDGPFPLAYAMSDGSPHSVRIQKRGEPTTPGDEVPRGFLTVWGASPLPADVAGSGRLELADWVINTPLFARVIVNRVWQNHFGQGLVRTPNDFGVRGQPPSDPELLDHLALFLIERQWSLKSLHRLILNSAAWQQGVLDDEGTHTAADKPAGPGGFARRRLSAEELRDAILTVTGELDSGVAQAHPFPDPTTFGFSQHGPFAAVYEHNRRSVYLMTQRLKRHPFLALFDGSDPNASTAERTVTTVPTQALYFLNDPFLHTASERWAQRLIGSIPQPERQLERAWSTALGRPPSTEELQESLEFLADYRRELQPLPEPELSSKSLGACLRLLLGSNEFLYLD
ncbi:MAG: PSD1 and planctomycete cytochrome C domain-containing protein [Planctomycetaceae bacterium]